MSEDNYIKVGTSDFARFKYSLHLNTKPTKEQTVSCHNNVPTYSPGQVISGYCELEVHDRSFVRGIWIKFQGEENIFYKQAQFNQYLKSCPPEDAADLNIKFPSTQSFELKFDILEQYCAKLKRIVNIAERRLLEETSETDDASTCPPSPQADRRIRIPLNGHCVRVAGSSGHETAATASATTTRSNREPSLEEGKEEEEEESSGVQSRAHLLETARQTRIATLKEQLTKCRRTLESVEDEFLLNGFQQVLLGLGEEVGREESGQLLTLEPGVYRYPFYFVLPCNFKYNVPKQQTDQEQDSSKKKSQENLGFTDFTGIPSGDSEIICAQLPPSYVDSNISCQYKLITAVDTPVVLLPATQICHNIIIDSALIDFSGGESRLKDWIYGHAADCAAASMKATIVADDSLLRPRYPVFGLTNGRKQQQSITTSTSFVGRAVARTCSSNEELIMVKAKAPVVSSNKLVAAPSAATVTTPGSSSALARSNKENVAVDSQNRKFLPQVFKQLFSSIVNGNGNVNGSCGVGSDGTTVRPSMVNKLFKRSQIVADRADAGTGTESISLSQPRQSPPSPVVLPVATMKVSVTDTDTEPHVVSFTNASSAPTVFKYTCRVDNLRAPMSAESIAVADDSSSAIMPFGAHIDRNNNHSDRCTNSSPRMAAAAAPPVPIKCIVQVCNQIWIRVPKHIDSIPSSTCGSHINLFMKNDIQYGSNWVLIRNYVLSESQQIIPLQPREEGENGNIVPQTVILNISVPVAAQTEERADSLSTWPYPRPLEHKVFKEQVLPVPVGTKPMRAVPRRNSFDRNAAVRRQILQGGGNTVTTAQMLPTDSSLPRDAGIASIPPSLSATVPTPSGSADIILPVVLPVSTVRQYTVQTGHYESRVVLDIQFVEERDAEFSIFPPCRTEIIVAPGSIASSTASVPTPVAQRRQQMQPTQQGSAHVPYTPPRHLASRVAGGRRGGRLRGVIAAKISTTPSQAHVSASPVAKPKTPQHKPKTPTAKPVRGRPAIKVKAACISRGPAAVIIDRSRRYASSRHPQNNVRSPRALPDGSNCVSLLTVIDPTVNASDQLHNGSRLSRQMAAVGGGFDPQMLSAATAAIINSIPMSETDDNVRSAVPEVVAAEAATSGGDDNDGDILTVAATGIAAPATSAHAAANESASSSSSLSSVLAGPPPVLVSFPQSPYLSPIPNEYIMVCQTEQQSLANRQEQVLAMESPEADFGGEGNRGFMVSRDNHSNENEEGHDGTSSGEEEEHGPLPVAVLATSPIFRVLRYDGDDDEEPESDQEQNQDQDQSDILELEEVEASTTIYNRISAAAIREAMQVAVSSTVHAVSMNASTVATARISAAMLPPPTPTSHYQGTPGPYGHADRSQIELSAADAVTLFNSSVDLNSSLNASGIADMSMLPPPDLAPIDDLMSPSPFDEQRERDLIVENI